MKNKLFFFFGIAILLSSCAIIKNNENMSNISIKGSVEAMVGTLENKTHISKTQSAFFTEQPQLINTPIVIQKPATSISVSPSITNTPSDFLDEPKVNLEFTKDASSFGISGKSYEDEAIQMSIENNALTIFPKMSNGWKSWRLRPPSFSDGASEADFSFLSCSQDDRFGIVLHAPDYESGKGIYCSINCEGKIQMIRDTSLLVNGDATAIISKQPNVLNQLKVTSHGNKITIYINQQRVAEAEDSTYSTGYTGFFTEPQQQNSLKIALVNFKIWY